MTILFQMKNLSYDNSIEITLANLKEKLQESKKWRNQNDF